MAELLHEKAFDALFLVWSRVIGCFFRYTKESAFS